MFLQSQAIFHPSPLICGVPKIPFIAKQNVIIGLKQNNDVIPQQYRVECY